jgi:predicted enzyme related to lactoylglutathione lyase
MGNPICHIDIPCKDIARARKFYGDVFGWDFEDFGESYCLFNTGSELGGGLNLQTEGPPAGRGVVLYLEVDDIPKKLEEIAAAGGSAVTGKTEITKEYGYLAVFTDTEGNYVGLWSKT